MSQTPEHPSAADAEPRPAPADPTPVHEPTPALPLLIIRCIVGGFFMGLANLVPGISGGTMLLAAGIYPRFIGAISEVTRLRFRKLSLLVLLAVVATALAAVVGASGLIVHMVVQYRWAMYALFIGLTLGGVPVIWSMLRAAAGGQRPGTTAIIPAILSFIGMAVVGYYQATEGGGGSAVASWPGMVAAGALAAGAMILPGISGGYLLLITGFYLPLVAGIRDLRDAVGGGDSAGLMEPVATIVLPVGIGVIIGIVVVSNVLNWTLKRFERQTLGVLLGLLIGSVAGLWPFQAGTAPQPGTMIKGETVVQVEPGQKLAEQTIIVGDDGVLMLEGTEQRYPDRLALAISGDPLAPEDWPTTFFTPNLVQILGAIGLIVVGFAITMLIARLGREKPKRGK